MDSTVGVDNQQAIRAAQELLKTLAITIEALGSLDRAIELGLAGSRESQLMQSGLLDIVPLSRGGDNAEPDADDKWAHVLATALLERGFGALDEVKALAGLIEHTASRREAVMA
jgi:hypothetical protein